MDNNIATALMLISIACTINLTMHMIFVQQQTKKNILILNSILEIFQQQNHLIDMSYDLMKKVNDIEIQLEGGSDGTDTF